MHIRGNFGRGRTARERGQALMLLVLGMTVIFFVGAIAVDVGLWLSEKRGAQTDADFPALAGAWELLPFVGNAVTAQTAVDDWAADNDETANLVVDNVVIDDSCFNQGTDDAVTVEVTHESRALFMSIFGIVSDPDIQAHAKACAGAAQGSIGVTPFEMDNNPGPCFDANEDPIFTSLCAIELEATNGNPRGMLDLEADDGHCSDPGGSGNIVELIETGASGGCLINTTAICHPDTDGQGGPFDDCVAIQAGNPQNVLTGLNNRFTNDGTCDSNYGNGDGVDDFSESVAVVVPNADPTKAIYEPRDCDPSTDGKQASPRLMIIIVLEDPPPSNSANQGFPILAFAGMYGVGCAPGTVVVVDEDDFTQEQRYCESPAGGPPGRMVFYSRFVNLIVTGAGVGPPNDQTTVFGIALVE